MFIVILICMVAICPSSFSLSADVCNRHAFLSRSAAAAALCAGVLVQTPVIPAHAEVSPPRVTAVATLDISILRGPTKPLRIELFGDAAPESVRFFSDLASGSLKAECPFDDMNCQENQNINVSYKGSQLWRLVPNKRIDFGRVDSMFANRIPPTFPVVQVGDLKPSARGAVSIKRGGGAFEFTITPVYNQALEKEDLVVVGRVAEEDMTFLDAISSIPSRKDIISVGSVPPLGSNFARACDFTAPDSTCAQFKPLKKVVVKEVSIKTVPELTVAPEEVSITTEQKPTVALE